MQTHVKVLGVLYIALSLMGVCAAIFLFLAIGTASGLVGMNAVSHDAAIALPIIGIAGGELFAFLLVVSLPGLITGVGLLKFRPWARIVGIVLAVLQLMNIPVGTVVGIYALWVLLSRETELLFSGALPPTTV